MYMWIPQKYGQCSKAVKTAGNLVHTRKIATSCILFYYSNSEQVELSVCGW